MVSLQHTWVIWYSLLLLGYKLKRHVTVLNTVGSYNALHWDIVMALASPGDRNFSTPLQTMGPLSYMQSVVDGGIIQLHTTVCL